MAFDQVRLGMTLADVDAVMHLSVYTHREKVGLKGVRWLDFPPDHASVLARWFGYRTIPDRFEVTLVRYLRPTFLRAGSNRAKASSSRIGPLGQKKGAGMWYEHPQRFPKNAPGPFYTLGHIERLGNWCGVCMACEAPEAEASQLLAPLKDGNIDTYFVRQPATSQEIEAACRAAQVCCVYALRDGGTDAEIIRRLRGVGRMLRDFLRRILGIRPPFITAERAVEIARQEVRRRGLFSDHPKADIRESVRAYHVHFGGLLNVKPGGPWVSVDLVSGRVLSFVHYNK